MMCALYKPVTSRSPDAVSMARKVRAQTQESSLSRLARTARLCFCVSATPSLSRLVLAGGVRRKPPLEGLAVSVGAADLADSAFASDRAELLASSSPLAEVRGVNRWHFPTVVRGGRDSVLPAEGTGGGGGASTAPEGREAGRQGTPERGRVRPARIE